MNHRAQRGLAVLILAVLLAGTTIAQADPAFTRARSADRVVHPGDRVIVLFADDTVSRDAFAAMAALGTTPSEVSVRPHGLAVVEVPTHTSAEEFAAALSDRSDVLIAAPDFEVHALDGPDDSAYPAAVGSGTGQRTYLGPVSEHPHAVNLEPLWEVAFGDGQYALAPDRTGVAIAVIDTGVTPSLREQTGEYTMVWDYANNDSDPSDDHSLKHGTRVASIIRAQTDNAFGIAGVLGASRNPVLVYKTLSSTGKGTIAWTAEAMLDASDRGARVINLSLGISPSSPALTAAQRALLDSVVAKCRANGSLVIAASGNAGTPGVYYPAASPGAIAVGAIEQHGDDAGQRWGSSSYGPELSLTAPGTSIWSVNHLDAFVSRSGTSYATPIVSGTAALLWSLMPGLTDADVEDILLASADGSVGPEPGFDIETGNGRLDAYGAFELLRSRVPTMHPSTLDLAHLGGFEYFASWTAPSDATGVFYRYGTEHGPTYMTSSTSGRVFVTGDGSRDIWVRAYAADRWPSSSATTVTVEVTTGLPDLGSARLAGRDRYGTAAHVARAAFPGDSPAVVLTTGADWPDALTAGPLAHALGGPVLMTRPTTLHVDTRNELLRLDPSTVVIVGGTAALSSNVEDTVRALLPSASIERIAGMDRYETAARVAERLVATTGAAGGRAFIASGHNWPDALAVSPAAAADGAPVLLTRPHSLPDPTRAALTWLDVEHTIIVGGTQAISDAVVASLPSPTRISGLDRYATAREIAAWSKDEGLLTGTGLGVSSGRSFADALVASPLLAARSEPLFLGDRLHASSAAWLAARDTSMLTVFGGPVALGIDAENAIKRVLRGTIQ